MVQTLRLYFKFKGITSRVCSSIFTADIVAKCRITKVVTFILPSRREFQARGCRQSEEGVGPGLDVSLPL